jgi:hypothetical protein
VLALGEGHAVPIVSHHDFRSVGQSFGQPKLDPVGICIPSVGHDLGDCGHGALVRLKPEVVDDPTGVVEP